MTVRCAIYLRQSLDATGEQLAVQRQRADCRRIAEQRGWTVVDEYVDNSISASDKHKRRPAYDQLVEAYMAGDFDAIVCWDLDRLTRQPRQLEDWIEAAEDRGLLLVTANGEADLTTDNGRLFARIKASVARSEVDRKSARQRAAGLQRSERGRPPLGVRLTGYTVAGELVPDEARTVERMFERFAAGDSLRSIAAWLTDIGVETRHGKAWNPSSVRAMLTNVRYAGRAVYQGEPTGKLGSWPPIVSAEVFEYVQSILTDPRRRTQQGTDRKHLGAGLYECAECVAGEVTTKVISWSGDRYRCPNGCLSRSREPVDKFVLAVVRGRLAKPDVAKLIEPHDSAEAKRLAARAKTLDTRLKIVENDYDEGNIDGRRFKVASDKIQAEIVEVQRAQARLSGNRGAESVFLAADPVSAFDGSPLMIRRKVIDAICTVALTAAPRGRKSFDPDTVLITPRPARRTKAQASG
jgi:DNA invertase Pin-like site-specific DNA recombinase